VRQGRAIECILARAAGGFPEFFVRADQPILVGVSKKPSGTCGLGAGLQEQQVIETR